MLQSAAACYGVLQTAMLKSLVGWPVMGCCRLLFSAEEPVGYCGMVHSDAMCLNVTQEHRHVVCACACAGVCESMCMCMCVRVCVLLRACFCLCVCACD